MFKDLTLVAIVIVLILSIISGIKNKDTKTKPYGGSDIFESSPSGDDDAHGNTNKKNENEQKESEKNTLEFYGWGYGSTADSEYLTIKASNQNKKPLKITGFSIVSTSTNKTVEIPKSTYLYFANSINTEEDVYLNPGETAYIITGRSPIGWGLKTNKCSGYLNQYNYFNPSISVNCPRPSDENLSSIPKTVNNDICFDLIDSLPSCRVQDTPLSNRYSTECQDFVYKKLTYESCINIHKNDKDFWGNTFYIYLKRSDRLWKDRRETLILYNQSGEIMGEVKRD